MNYPLLLLAIYSAAVAETAVMPSLGAGSAAPDLLLIVGLAWLFGQRGWHGLFGALCAGLASDLNGAGRLGPAVATMALAAWAVEQLRGKLPLRRPFAQAVCTLPAAWLLATLAAAAQYSIASQPFALVDFIAQAGCSSLATAVLALPVFAFCSWWRGTRWSARWQIPLAR